MTAATKPRLTCHSVRAGFGPGPQWKCRTAAAGWRQTGRGPTPAAAYADWQDQAQRTASRAAGPDVSTFDDHDTEYRLGA